MSELESYLYVERGMCSSNKHFRQYACMAFKRAGIDLDKHEIIFMDYTRGRLHFAKAMIKART